MVVTNTKEVDYSKHINVSSPKQEVKTNETIDYLKALLAETRQLSEISPTTYHVVYSIDTSVTSKQEIDIVTDIGNPALEMTIVEIGGGFTLQINDESTQITMAKGLRVYNEKIERVEWIGSGTSGTGKIRFGLIK